MYKFFLTMRYLRTRRIAYFSMLAIAMAVGMVLVVYSVMSGFLDHIENNARKISGDIIIEAGGLTTFPYYDEFIDTARAELGGDVAAMTPVVSAHGLLKMLHELGREKDRTVYVAVQGIRLEEYARVTPFAESLFYEGYYPGTTRFEPAALPTWWIDERGHARLPDLFEDALSRYCAESGDARPCDAALRVPNGEYELGPGSFAPTQPSMQERPEYRGQPRPGAILGIELVVVRRGDAVYRMFPKGTELNLTLLVPTRKGKVSPDSGRTFTLRYVDDSYTRVYPVDKAAVYCDFEWLQHRLDLEAKPRVDGGGLAPARASRIQLKLADGVDHRDARRRLQRLWTALIERHAPDLSESDRAGMRRVQILTWDEKHADIIAPVRNERVLMLVLFGLVSGVAVLVVGCVFYMIVQDKSREIGIIKSMGASSLGVAGIFVVYAMGMGLAGSVVGAAGGTCFVWKINELQELLVRLNPNLRVWSPEVYAFDRIPNTVDPLHAVCIIAVAILASILGSVTAARRAASVWPVNALRYE